MGAEPTIRQLAHGFAPSLRAVLSRVGDVLKEPPVALTLLAALLATQVLPLWSPTSDGVGYLSIARSIAHGGPPTNLGTPKLHYPIGYPLLIAPLFWINDRPLLLLMALQWVFCIVFMLGVYSWARRWFADGAVPITAFVMSSASLWMHARTTLSEPAFMALLIWTACAADRLVATSSARETWRRGLALSALSVALALVKPVGVLIAAGYATVLFLRAWHSHTSWMRTFATIALVPLPAMVCVAAQVAYEAHTAELVGTANAPTYLHEFKEAHVSLTSQLIEGLRIRVAEVGRLALPGMFKAFAKPRQWWNINTAIYFSFAALLSWAWWRLARHGANVLLMVFPFFFVLYVAYPSDQGTRYLLPMLPVIAACAWWLISRLPRHRTAWLSAVIGAHLIVALSYSVQGTLHLQRLNAEWKTVDIVAAMLRTNAAPAGVGRLPNGIAEMVMLSSDRSLHRIAGGDPPPAEVRIMVAQSESQEYADFVEQARAGKLKLLAREEQVARVPAPTEPAAPR